MPTAFRLDMTLPACLTRWSSTQPSKRFTKITLFRMKRSEVPPKRRLRCQTQTFSCTILNCTMEWSLVTIHMTFTRLSGFKTFVKEET
ncbi:hypothetical protein TMatcc_003114 [Talaromyces marneffei ATCC 18224]|uniref:uncharacterized protein n=1 Tax=Talaromyces marneffei TaxID=37727 RepID=UPI0012A7E374|nr:uncharacterized protein EYB26_001831 [Talaromyces marneffei]QGA14178.1 hypothetical protein EYB26_001831 [Talaromyces marneffei]